MIETHPFGDFIPPKARYLILGSFTGRQSARGSSDYDQGYDWFYGTRRNQFWPILEAVYPIPLKNKQEKQALFTRLGIAIADIIYRCERRKRDNQDSSLINIIYNDRGINRIFRNNRIEKVYFSSRFVNKLFTKHFQGIVKSHPTLQLITLPSPSPRYARISKNDKIVRYQELLPPLKQ